MADLIKRALTRKHVQRGRLIREEPDEKLVLGVKFAIAMTACLTVLEVAHMAFLGRWNSEIFAGITGLSGVVTGVFLGQRI